MTYEQARQGVAKQLFEAESINDQTFGVLAKENIWARKEAHYLLIADDVIEELLTPTQLEAWKDGGELAVTDPDQSVHLAGYWSDMPDMPTDRQTTALHEIGWRRVVLQSGEVIRLRHTRGH